jgi:hypothetical protein
MSRVKLGLALGVCISSPFAEYFRGRDVKKKGLMTPVAALIRLIFKKSGAYSSFLYWSDVLILN